MRGLVFPGRSCRSFMHQTWVEVEEPRAKQMFVS